jgi:hypothetical protein
MLVRSFVVFIVFSYDIFFFIYRNRLAAAELSP